MACGCRWIAARNLSYPWQKQNIKYNTIMKTNLLSLLLSLTTTITLFGQNSSKLTNWSFELRPVSGDIYEIRATAKIAEGWYTYSANLESDLGPIPTSFTIENAEAMPETKEEGNAIKGYDDMFLMNIVKYKKEVTFVKKVKMKGKSVKGFVTFMMCDAEKCLPPTDVAFELSR